MKKYYLIAGCIMVVSLMPLSAYAELGPLADASAQKQTAPERERPKPETSEPETSEQGPLTIMGLRLGQLADGAAPILKAADFEVRNPQAAKVLIGKTKSGQSQFLHKNGQTLSLDVSGDDHLITGIHYYIGEDIDVVAGLQSDLRSRYGSPLARYILAEDSQMLVWERVSPSQSRDFGPMTTIALTTGSQAKLSLTQFSTLQSARPRSGLRPENSRPIRALKPSGAALSDSPID